jgi:DNA-binding transcriptional ArsR family regulator
MTHYEDPLQSVTGLFQVLSNATRLKLLGLLRRDEMDVTHLQAALKISQSSVSQHLALLKLHGLVSERKEGKHVYYRVKNPQVNQVVASAFQLIALDLASGNETLSSYLELLSLWGG